VLIEEINDLMVTEPREDMQLENGQLLGRLLLPSNLTPAFFGSRPVVLALDAATARIHWEMVARTDLLGRGDSIGKFRSRHHFFGTGIGLTRQLRTTFAPPPEAPPPARRVLRVLVVADPAADAPLPGAQQEGEAVADLFESYNSVDSHNEVHVTRLIGPRRATRVNFLREVLVRQPSYDVLHFAGHCFFDPLEPSRSGWIFSDGQTITARELDRIDRIPPFVFSNACESGITPDRSGTASSGLAPSFAEAFYKCGVSNFVCTGWPVDDRAAREFAVKLYSDLLGLKSENSPDGDAAPRPAHMYEAMRNARLEIASTPGGALTWGAYQHYGNPFYRFFAEADAGAARKKSSPPKPNRKKKSKPQPRTKKASKRKRAG
jgi:hypothetical protein